MKYSKLLFAIVIIGAVLQLPTHLEYTVGDQLFHLLNIPINSNGETGFHYPVIGSLATLVSLFILQTLHIKKHPRLILRSIVCIVIVMIIFPHITKGLSYAVFYSSHSTSNIHIVEESCDLTINDSVVEGSCEMTVFNYGNVNQVEVVPILPSHYYYSKKIIFNPSTVSLDSHKTNHIKFQVTGTSNEISSATYKSPVDVRIIN